jgi:nucleoside-diphosphate-sugar epimerase
LEKGFTHIALSFLVFKGGSGYIAGHIIKNLFEKGYRVRAIVRDLKKEEKYRFLKELSHKEGQLEFAEAELTANQYEKAFQGSADCDFFQIFFFFFSFLNFIPGCVAIIHTATPYVYSAPDPQVTLPPFFFFRD